MTDARFPASARLRKREEFDAVFQRSAAASNRFFRVLCGSDFGASPRLGLAISRKAARRAVDRNRIKRIVRESFRHQACNLVARDFVVLARPEAATATRAELRQAIDGLWNRAASAPMQKPRRPRAATAASRHSG